jgi:hypothetical protein
MKMPMRTASTFAAVFTVSDKGSAVVGLPEPVAHKNMDTAASTATVVNRMWSLLPSFSMVGVGLKSILSMMFF